MKYALLLRHDTINHPSSRTAYHFAETLLKMGHEISCVFLTHHAVSLASTLPTLPRDEIIYSQKWLDLAQKYHFELIACSSSAIARGVLNKEQAIMLEPSPAENLKPGYQLGGLGYFVSVCAQSDRVMTFGG